MAIQVQLRGGTSDEHNSFIGVPREVTVDTTFYTLRVHDGHTIGGNPLATVTQLNEVKNEITKELESFQNNVAQSHNHDDRYSLLTHNHDGQYVKTVEGGKGLFTKIIGDYHGLLCHDNTDTRYIRTTKNGLLPYQSGGYSNIGSSSWRFASGYFNTINSNDVVVNGGELKLSNSAGINFNNDDRLIYDDSTNEYQLSSDGQVNKARLCLGHIELSGRRIYIGSSFPSGARTNDILIQI